MQFFVDTADIEEIDQANKLGILDGVTTNPTLIARTGRPPQEVYHEISRLISGPVSCEVLSTDYEGMMREALDFSKIASHIVVKLPLTHAGIQATKTCSQRGIATNITLCFSANQALIAAKAGATYISPFLGRLDDLGQSGLLLLQEIRQIYDNYDFPTKILAASLRSTEQVKQAALIGADVATMPLKILKQLIVHPLTEQGLKTFLSDIGRL